MSKITVRRESVKVGDKFNRWEIRGDPYRKVCGRSSPWVCLVKCKCGVEKVVDLKSVLHGTSRSCGCLKNETTGDRTRTHGQSGSVLHRVWRGIKERCTSQSHTSWHRYGGRGIRMCDEWAASFETFRDWALANGWKQGLEIDRKDNDKNYEPSNCRLVTHKVNCNNQGERNKMITAWGETKTLWEWSIDPRCCVQRERLKVRIYKGWAPERAMTEPLGKQGKLQKVTPA